MQRVGVKFWAWAASIVVHLTVLTAFGIVKFSRSETLDKSQSVPTAKIARIDRVTRPSPLLPKPKIKKPAETTLPAVVQTRLAPGPMSTNAAPQSPAPHEHTRPSASAVFRALADDEISPSDTRFFGSTTDERKLCYLVDCSGSMCGIFARVRNELKQSVQNLRPDQYFHIVFFGGDKLYEFGRRTLVRATPQTKSAACAFIDSIRPAGTTNAMPALERAMQIRDHRSVGPSVIYFLTDGFELNGRDTHKTSRKILTMLKNFAPTTKINAIAFWPQPDDCKVLNTIAHRSGGRFVAVSDNSETQNAGN